MSEDTFTSTEDGAAGFERMRALHEGWVDTPEYDGEPDPPDYEPEEEPDDRPEEPTEIPADWVEGYDDNSASERGSHWEDK